MDDEKLTRVLSDGFFAALDQSGGSTPAALADYGLDRSTYANDDEMFRLIQSARARVIMDPGFDGTKIVGTILFRQTMDHELDGPLTGDYLWSRKRIVPFLKVDLGLEDVSEGAQLMKPIDNLDESLSRAVECGMFGTKMRSLITEPNERGIAAVVDQQFDVAGRIAESGLVPIIEPEISIDVPEKARAERLLHDRIAQHVEQLPRDRRYLLKLTIPDEAGRYADLADDPRIVRVLALSGGYGRDDACARLQRDPAMIASFSRALLEGLTAQQTAMDFTARLAENVEEIFAASTHKTD